MATDLFVFSREYAFVTYGGILDSVLGTKMVPQWMKNDVNGARETVSSLGQAAEKFINDDTYRDQALKSMGKSIHEGWDKFWADPAYNLGGLTFDVASLFIGAGEVKAGLTAAKGSASFVKGVAAFGKAAGKAAIKNADDMARGIGRMISRGDDLTRKMAGNLSEKVARLGDNATEALAKSSQALNQRLGQMADGARGMLEGRLTAQDAFALATGSFDDFSHHGAKVYGMSDDLARQTGRVSSNFAREAVEGGVGRGSRELIPSVENMSEFFKTDFGSELEKSLRKTKKRYDGQTVYEVTDKSIPGLKKGDQIYLDGLHKDHLEVFDKRGNFIKVLDLDGTNNIDKFSKAGKRKLP